jgi:hypothetical protein
MWPVVIVASTALTLTAAAGITVAARSDDRPLQVGGITETADIPEVTHDLTQGWTSDPFGGGAIPKDYLTVGGDGSTMPDPIGGGVAVPKGYGTSPG